MSAWFWVWLATTAWLGFNLAVGAKIIARQKRALRIAGNALRMGADALDALNRELDRKPEIIPGDEWKS